VGDFKFSLSAYFVLQTLQLSLIIPDVSFANEFWILDILTLSLIIWPVRTTKYCKILHVSSYIRLMPMCEAYVLKRLFILLALSVFLTYYYYHRFLFLNYVSLSSILHNNLKISTKSYLLNYYSGIQDHTTELSNKLSSQNLNENGVTLMPLIECSQQIVIDISVIL